MTDEKTLRGECIGLNINIGLGKVVDQTGLTDIWISSKNESSLIGVDAGKSAHMLSNFFEVAERGLQFFDEGTHSTEGSSLKLFASVERISVFH